MAAEEEAATAALNVVVPSVEIMMERMTEQQMSEKKKAMEKLFFRILGTLTRADLKPTCNNWPTDKKGTKSEQAIGWHKV